MFRSRCSRENDSSLERWVRTTSPSRTVTGRPSASSWATSASATVDLPAPDSPVRNTVTPVPGAADMPVSVPQRVARAAPGEERSAVLAVPERPPGALDGDQFRCVRGQPAGDDVGEGEPFEHPPVGLAGGDPDPGQRLGDAGVDDVLGALPLHLGEEALLDA